MPNQLHPDNDLRLGPLQFGRDLWDDVERFADEDQTATRDIIREAVRLYANARNRAAAGLRPVHNHYGGNVCGRHCPAWREYA